MDLTQPGPPPTGAAPTTISDLTTLAAELHQRGYTTHITTTPPHLTLSSPGITHPQHIHTDPQWFTWHDPAMPYGPAPFTLRSTPLYLAADHAARVMRILTRTHQTASPTPHPQDTP